MPDPDTIAENKPKVPVAAENKLKPQKTLIKAVFPKRTNLPYYIGLGLGAMMVLGGIYLCISHPRVIQQGLFVFCFGIALIGVAYGSQATVRLGSIIVTGVAATALAFFFVLGHKIDNTTRLNQKLVESSYVRGFVESMDRERFQGMTMRPGIEFFGKFDASNDYFEFAIFKALPKPEQVNITLVSDQEGDIIFSVSRNCLAHSSHETRKVEWQIRENEIEEGGETIKVPAIYDRLEEKFIATHGGAQAVPCVRQITQNVDPEYSMLARSWSFVSSAIAQTVRRSANPSRNDLKQALDNLASQNTSVRRDARSILGRAPIDFIPQITTAMRSRAQSNNNEYRWQLGGTVALTLILRANHSKTSEIQSQLSRDDLNMFIKLAGHQDRTMRIYATELLTALGDPRATKAALSKAGETQNTRAKYNYLSSSRTGWQKLGDVEKQALRPALEKLESDQNLNTKTRSLLRVYE